MVHRIVLDIDTVDAQRAPRHVVQPGDELHQGGFGRSGAPQDPHRLPRGNVQADVGEHIFRRCIGILEIHVIKIDAAPLHPRAFPPGGRNSRHLVEHLRDAGGGGHGTGEHHEHAGNHHQGIEDLQHIAEKAGQPSHLHAARVHHAAAEP